MDEKLRLNYIFIKRNNFLDVKFDWEKFFKFCGQPQSIWTLNPISYPLTIFSLLKDFSIFNIFIFGELFKNTFHIVQKSHGEKTICCGVHNNPM